MIEKVIILNILKLLIFFVLKYSNNKMINSYPIKNAPIYLVKKESRKPISNNTWNLSEEFDDSLVLEKTYNTSPNKNNGSVPV